MSRYGSSESLRGAPGGLHAAMGAMTLSEANVGLPQLYVALPGWPIV
jgi:hypothetical protein